MHFAVSREFKYPLGKDLTSVVLKYFFCRLLCKNNLV
jgi:hypothetical protein